MIDALLAKEIHDKAVSCGFDNCGIIPIDDMDRFEEYFQERKKAVPSSAFFYEAVGDLAGIKRRFPWAKSVVVCSFWLGRYKFPASLQGRYAKGFFLSPGNETRSDFLESREQFETWFAQRGVRCEGGGQFGHLSIGPLRHAAVAAGIGIIRKNNFLYTEKGSFVELTGYVIDRECELRLTPNLKPCAENAIFARKAVRAARLKVRIR